MDLRALERILSLVLLSLVVGLVWDRNRTIVRDQAPIAEESSSLRTRENEQTSHRQLSSSSASSASPSHPVCSREDFLFQLDNFELVGLHICDSDLLWDLMQLSLPDSRVFLDIGGNLGYTAARIFGLWTPGHKFNRKSLRKGIVESLQKHLGLTNNTKQTTTYCRDGRSSDTPLVCVGHQPRPECISRRNIEVYSFDGQALHVENQRRLVYHYFPHLHPNYEQSRFNGSSHVKASWEYIHAAMTNALASTNERTGYFLVNDNEHGMLVREKSIVDKMIQESKPDEPISFVPVPLLTVDLFVRERGLPQVDVIKVDAEGADVQVLMGALETIRDKGVKVLTFECSQCLDRAKYEAFFKLIDSEYDFDCYLNGGNQIVVKMTNGCWDYNTPVVKPTCTRPCPGYLNSKSANAWGTEVMDSNAYCIHRRRASALHTLVDNLSLHHYSDPSKRGHFLKDAFLSVDDIDFEYSAERSDWQMKRNHRGNLIYHRHFGRDPKTSVKYGTIDSSMG